MSAGNTSSRRTKPSSIRLASGPRLKPSASSVGVQARGSSSRASGLPRVSATIRSRTRGSIGPGRTESSNARASVVVQATDLEFGESGQFVLDRRPGQRRPSPPTRPPGAGRRTPAPARTPGRATVRRRRCTALAAGWRRRTAGSGRPGRRGTGPAPVRSVGRTPYRGPRAADVGGGRSGPGTAGRADGVRRRRAPSRTRPRRRERPGRSWLLATSASSNADLPTPGSPRRTRTSLRPVRAALSNPFSTAVSRPRPRSSSPRSPTETGLHPRRPRRNGATLRRFRFRP